MMPFLPECVIIHITGERIDTRADSIELAIAAGIGGTTSVEINDVIAPRSMRLENAILTSPSYPKRRAGGDVIFLHPKRDAQGIVFGTGVEEAAVLNINPASAGGGRIDRVVSRLASMTALI